MAYDMHIDGVRDKVEDSEAWDELQDKFRDEDRAEYTHHQHGQCPMDCYYCERERRFLEDELDRMRAEEELLQGHWWQQEDQDEEWTNAS